MASNLSQTLRRVGGLTVQRLSQGLKESNSDASGELDTSIGFNIKPTSKGIDLNITMLDYWEFVDKGRKPGKPAPVNKIMEWLTYPNVRDKMRFGQSDAAFTESEQKSLAYLISRKIGREGTKGNDFASNVFNSKLIQTELPDLVLNAVFEDASIAIDELINNFGA
jgi:hypothetical protein